jgi:hypothetical protein
VNLDDARRVADAVLYEGYILYPYRASAQKNRSRWQFGVLMPAEFVADDPSERADLQAECVLEHRAGNRVEVLLRFLQVQRRTVDRWTGELFEPVPELEVDGHTVLGWDESVEREVSFPVTDLSAEARHDVEIPGGEDVEELRDRVGALVGRLVRRRTALSGTITVTADPLPGPWGAVRLRVRVDNRTARPGAGTAEPDSGAARREAALPGAFLASHLILAAPGGAFVSMVDPPEWASQAVAGCVNTGVWPVLAGRRGDRELVLASPIILYDHPELAPESPGDLFDGTEIDEILTLRTLALSDEEKRQARATDPRAAAVIDRTESLDAEVMARLHGAIREMRPVVPAGSGWVGPDPGVPASSDVPWWDPGIDASVSPETDAVEVNGTRLARGSRVVLRPGVRRADAQDMFLAGRAAVVEAVLTDVDDETYLAVTLTDDPAGDLLSSHGRFLYFSPDEVEPSSGDGGEIS